MLNKVITIVYIREMVLNQNKNECFQNKQPKGGNLLVQTSLLLSNAKQSLNKNRINIYTFLINLI